MSVKKNILYNIINNISAVLFPFITVPYVSRVLGVENIGIVGFATTYAQYFALFAALGVPLYGIKEIAKVSDSKEKRSKLFTELFTLTIFSSIFCSIVYVTTIFTIPKLYEQKEFMFVAGTMVYLSAFSFDWYFSGRENFKLITIRSLIIKLIAVITMFAIVKTDQDAIYYCAITAMAIILNNIWNFFYILKKEVRISFKDLSFRPHTKPLLTLLVTNIAISVYTILDTIMLGLLSNYTQVGFYNSAIRITRLLLPFAVTTTSVLIPKISYCLSQNDTQGFNHYLKRSFAVISFFAVPISIGLMIVSPNFVPLFFGNEFLGTIIPMQILSAILILVGISNFFGLQVLVTSGHETKLLYCILTGTFINFCCNLLVIPKFGATGAASTSVLAEFVIMLTTAITAYKTVKLRINFIPLTQAFIACIPMVLAYFLLPRSNDINSMIVLITIGVLTYGLTQYVIFKNQIAIELLERVIKIIKR